MLAPWRRRRTLCSLNSRTEPWASYFCRSSMLWFRRYAEAASACLFGFSAHRGGTAVSRPPSARACPRHFRICECCGNSYCAERIFNHSSCDVCGRWAQHIAPMYAPKPISDIEFTEFRSLSVTPTLKWDHPSCHVCCNWAQHRCYETECGARACPQHFCICDDCGGGYCSEHIFDHSYCGED